MACYYGMTSLMDREIGHILDALQKSGRADNTIVAREIRLVFDTGQHRELTFSLSEHTNRNIL